MKKKWIEEDSNSYFNPTSSTTADSIAPVSDITPTLDTARASTHEVTSLTSDIKSVQFPALGQSLIEKTDSIPAYSRTADSIDDKTAKDPIDWAFSAYSY